MNDGYNEKERFLRRVGNQKLPHPCEPYWPGREIGTQMALIRKCDQRLNGRVNLFPHPVRSFVIVFGDQRPPVAFSRKILSQPAAFRADACAVVS